MMKRLCILGSTGSIGTQTLEVVRGNQSEFQVTALTAGDNITLLAEQIAEFHPQIVAVKSGEGAKKLEQRLLEKEIEKTKTKIAEMQAKLHKLEEQKTELENTDYVAVARSFKLTPQQLADFLKSQQAAPSETVLPQEKEDVHEA